jgi:hypothetical protein
MALSGKEIRVEEGILSLQFKGTRPQAPGSSAEPLGAGSRAVADLFDLLARGGSVPVRVEGWDGKEYTLEVTARRQ